MMPEDPNNHTQFEVEDFRELKAERAAKRAQNRESSAELLKAAGFKFESKNFDAHLIVKANGGGIVDFWPGTGRWIVRATGQRGFGVKNLIKVLRS